MWKVLLLGGLLSACSSSDDRPACGVAHECPSGFSCNAQDVCDPSGDGGGNGDGGSVRGCNGPPAIDFDPVSSYPGSGLTPSVVVMNGNDDGADSLRAVIAAAPPGAVVGFAPHLAGTTIRLTRRIELTRSVTIDGGAAPGLTIDGDLKDSALHFNGDAPTKLAVFSLRITRGRTVGSGGAISVNGGALELEIGGVTFVDNAAGEGGAVRAGYRSIQTFVHDSTFLRNDGSLTGSGFSGGAISASGGALHVVRCRFDANVGSTSGAVYAIHANPVIEYSVLVGNRSSGAGGSGAVFVDGGGPGDYGNGITTPGAITLRGLRVEGNRGAGDDGGAAELYAYPFDTVTIESATFRNNQSNPGRAGALFIHADNVVDLRRVAFVGNTATRSGGAIWADGNARYSIENALFSGNASMGDLGGALRMELAATGTLRIASTTIVDNVASGGNGALWLPGIRDVSVRNTIVANNTGSAGAQQINFPVTDGGGNLEWPASGASTRTLAMARTVDPLLELLAVDEGTWVRAPASGSPALDSAMVPAPALDQRGAHRDATPDTGAFEVGGTCD